MDNLTKKQWNYALVQHPMWLIIAEDSICAERTPPWGCPSLEEYVSRLNLSMDAVEEHQDLRLTFDFSAVELEDVYTCYPELLQRMRKLVAGGLISFVNGTYSQPHLQMLSIESVIRQFGYGLRSIEDLTGYRITCYAGQEPGITPYLPQILLASGYLTASTPDFPFGVRLIDGQIQHWDKRWEWTAGDDIVNWKAPDGSMIPLWLKSSGCPHERTSSDEYQHGLLGHTRLRVDMPDMLEVTSDWVEERANICEFVMLDETLEKLSSSDPYRATAFLDANYAYCEGVDAGELSRANTRAESALLALEALRTMVDHSTPVSYDIDAAWKTLLKAQHHDAYWTGAPELRAKAMDWLGEISGNAKVEINAVLDSLGRKLPETPEDSIPVIVAGTYGSPHRMPVEIPVESDHLLMVDEEGKNVPVRVSNSRASFVAECKGLGYRTYFLHACEESREPVHEPLKEDYHYSNQFYSITISPDATIKSLAPHAEPELLDSNGGNRWLYQDNGRDVTATPLSAWITRGQVFDLIDAESTLGPCRIHSRIFVYHGLPWFEVTTELTFDTPAEIGDYFDDRTKLHFAWHLREPGLIRHAVGGWPVTARPCRSFIASPWVDAGNIALCLFSANKCWVDENNTLRCVIGWGHNGDHFHNRQGPLPGIMGPLNWAKPMDLRLRGKYCLRYGVRPHGKGMEEAETAAWSSALLMPPTAGIAASGNGTAPWSDTYISLDAPGLIPLSVRRRKGDKAILRFVEMAGKSHNLNEALTGKWHPESAHELDGTPLQTIRPYKIIEASFKASQA